MCHGVERAGPGHGARLVRATSHEPDPADGPAVERVRAELARLGDDAASAPDVPRPVTERVVSALRTAPPVRRTPAVRISAAVGVAAALLAAGIGTVTLQRSGSSVPPTESSAKHLPEPARGDGAAFRRRDRRAAEPSSRPRCTQRSAAAVVVSERAGLSGAGRRARRPASRYQRCAGGLLVLPGDTPDTVAALAVRPNCSSVDTGLLADTQIRRP